ncbi:MAG: sodium:alanine symporter family protein [Pseudomonadota bacterium]|nr:sodium:alanine symporter family protein [Pseudomonadota bacterium]
MDNQTWIHGFTNSLNTIDGYLGSAQYFPFVLLATGMFLTFYLKFPQIRYFNHAWRVLSGRYESPDAKGDASHFQALTTAISGTVGTGNIGGVALAIYLGGPAALFWMWMTAFFGMTTKFVEVTLSHKYRGTDAKGFIVGGPMYVMEKRLNMKWLAVFFALATVVSSFGTGNLPQSNNIASGLSGTFGIPEWLTGAILATVLGLVIVGGISRIVKVAEKIVPFMALIYVIGALSVIIANLDQVGDSLLAVLSDAFTGSAATGGFLGATFAYAFNRGVNRGLFSNEAGQGSAPIAHAAAKAEDPVSEGMVSILEPFIDTIIICTLTGLVILSSGVWTEKHQNHFQKFDMQVLNGSYSEDIPAHRAELFSHLNSGASDVELYDGVIQVIAGTAVSSEHTVLHNRSVAEDVYYLHRGEPYTGPLTIQDGKLTNDVEIHGRSLIHSVDLTAEAFSRGLFGEFGRYIVALGLVLFAFTTAVAWSYYGDRAMTYLFGVNSLIFYRSAYVLGFFFAAIADTSLVWLIAAITIAFMTLPNLFSMIVLHQEVKQTIAEYWTKFHIKYPEKGSKIG